MPDAGDGVDVESALFGDDADGPGAELPPRDDSAAMATLGSDEDALFASVGAEVAHSASARPPAGGRGLRILVAVVAALVVLGLGGVAYALFGTSSESPAPTIAVKGTQVTRTQLRASTTASTTASPSTTTNAPTTMAAPTTADATPATATHAPVAQAPAEEPVPTDLAVAEPPPIGPPPPWLPPATEPSTTTTTTTTTTTAPPPDTTG